jgi:hypothetical protein
MDKRVNNNKDTVPFRTKYFRDERLLMVKASPRMEIYIGREYNAYRLFLDGNYCDELYKDEEDGIFHFDVPACEYFEDYADVDAKDFIDGLELTLELRKPLVHNYVNSIEVERKGEAMEIGMDMSPLHHPEFILHEYNRLLKSMMLRCTLYGLTIDKDDKEDGDEYGFFRYTLPLEGTIGDMVNRMAHQMQLLMNESG